MTEPEEEPVKEPEEPRRGFFDRKPKVPTPDQVLAETTVEPVKEQEAPFIPHTETVMPPMPEPVAPVPPVPPVSSMPPEEPAEEESMQPLPIDHP